jgi:hypothetical protein
LGEVHEFGEGEIKGWCLDDLAIFKVSRRIVALDDFPKLEGPNGVKIHRGELRKMALEVVAVGDGG